MPRSSRRVNSETLRLMGRSRHPDSTYLHPHSRPLYSSSLHRHIANLESLHTLIVTSTTPTKQDGQILDFCCRDCTERGDAVHLIISMAGLMSSSCCHRRETDSRRPSSAGFSTGKFRAHRQNESRQGLQTRLVGGGDDGPRMCRSSGTDRIPAARATPLRRTGEKSDEALLFWCKRRLRIVWGLSFRQLPSPPAEANGLRECSDVIAWVAYADESLPSWRAGRSDPQ